MGVLILRQFVRLVFYHFLFPINWIFKMNKPELSIVIPVYNAGKYLKDAISDLLHQTYENFELICVDDGSTDQSSDVLNFFARDDERIKIISQENKGAGEARNAGMNHISGNFVIFLDSDDRYRLELLEKVIGRAKETNADITLFNAYILDEVEGDYYEQEWVLNLKKNSVDTFCFKDYPDRFFQITSGMPWNKLFRSDFIKNEGIQFQSIPYWNDTFFTFMLMVRAQKIAFLDEKLMFYRMKHFGSITSSKVRTEHPEYGFELLFQLKEALKKEKCYETLKGTFAEFAMERILSLLEVLNENNSSAILDYFSDSFIRKLEIEDTPRKAFRSGLYFKTLNCLLNMGTIPTLSMLYGHKAYDCEWNFRKMCRLEDMIEDTSKCFFSLSGVPEGSNIVLYGAGNRGKELYKEIELSGKYHLTEWVDQNAERLNEEWSYPLKLTRIIMKSDFDYIIIATDNVEIADDITGHLLKLGICRNRIIW